MRYHLDTSFLIDWHRGDPRVHPLLNEVLNGLHEISVDHVIQTEYFGAEHVDRSKQLIYDTALILGALLPLTSAAAQLAAAWLAPMDRPKRLAHFADALIAATAETAGAMLVTGDRRIARVFPIAVFEY